MNATDIEGWMSEAELAWLAEQARTAHRIVEVGCWKGRSTVALASSTPGVVWAVDTWRGVPHDPATQADWYPVTEGVYQEFLRNIEGLRVLPKRMTSLQAAASVQLAKLFNRGAFLDMVFIDADHAYEAVRADILAWRPLVRPGGLLCGHDYEPGCSGVIRAVDELLPHALIGPDSIWSVVV